MDFDLTQDQKMLADTVAAFARQSSPVERFRKLRDDATGYEPAVWKQMGELGWLSVPFPEAVGGFGGTFNDVAVIVEKLGTTLVPEPYVASVVLAGSVVRDAGDAEQQKRWLGPMMAGDTTLALAWAERRARYDVSSPATRAKKDGSGYRIDGEKVFVENGHAAAELVVSAALDGGVALFVVDRTASGVTAQPIQLIDGRRAANVRFEGALVSADRMLGSPSDGVRVLDHALDYGAAAAVAEGLGIVTTMLHMTVGYLKEREQFGVPIGSFQALQHRAVDMFVEQQLCHAVNVLACVTADEKDPAVRKPEISAAKVQLATGGKLIAQQAIQLHGGIGITDEHDVGLYFKRLQALNALYGDLEHHTKRFMNAPSFA